MITSDYIGRYFLKCMTNMRRAIRIINSSCNVISFVASTLFRTMKHVHLFINESKCKKRGAGLSPAPLLRLLRCYTDVQVCNTCMPAEESDFLLGAMSIRKVRVNIDIGIINSLAICSCSIFLCFPLFERRPVATKIGTVQYFLYANYNWKYCDLSS